MKLVFIYLIITNVVAFVTYGVDKWKAKKSRWRIPEKTLILLAAMGGALGAYSGMKYFRHKTQHKKFTICVPLFLIIWIIGLVWLTVNV